MKTFSLILSLIILLSSPNPAGAVSLVNKAIIQEAQNYGVKSSQLALTEFLAPWLAYEEQAQILNEKTERAYLYTPFLLVANDARDRARNKQQVKLADSEKILADYAGCLVFSITIHDDSPTFIDKETQIVIKQANRTLKPYYAVTNPPLQAPWFPQEPQFTVHCYFYFSDKEVALDQPITLVITTKDKHERRFYFGLSKFK